MAERDRDEITDWEAWLLEQGATVSIKFDPETGEQLLCYTLNKLNEVDDE